MSDGLVLCGISAFEQNLHNRSNRRCVYFKLMGLIDIIRLLMGTIPALGKQGCIARRFVMSLKGNTKGKSEDGIITEIIHIQ